MERAHVFFESFDAFVLYAAPKRPVYAIQLQHSEKTGVSGLTRVIHAIHLSQIVDGVAHHCVMRIAQHIEPVEQHERETNRARADRAWEITTQLLSARFEKCVFGGLCAHPEDITRIYAGLPAEIGEQIDV